MKEQDHGKMPIEAKITRPNIFEECLHCGIIMTDIITFLTQKHEGVGKQFIPKEIQIDCEIKKPNHVYKTSNTMHHMISLVDDKIIEVSGGNTYPEDRSSEKIDCPHYKK